MLTLKKKGERDRRVLDRADRRILTLVQANGRLTNKELARSVNLSPTPCLRRMSLLEKDGYIERYKAVVDPAKVGYTVRAFVSIKRSRESSKDAIWKRVCDVPEVIACHVVSGEFDLLVELVAHDMDHFAKLTLETIAKIDGIYDVRSTFSIKALKTEGDLPL